MWMNLHSVMITQSLSRLRRQLPLHKGAFRFDYAFAYTFCTAEENFRRLLLDTTTVYEGTPSDAE